MRTTLLAILLLFQASLFFVLPSLGTSVFLSPDETANAVFARLFAHAGDMRVTDPLLREFPWMHPRSVVTQGSAMVPVGFLGMPMLLGGVLTFFGEWGVVFFTPLLALSVAFPLWRFFASSGRAAQIAAVLTWLSFPSVILYANRGLFANLPVVCLVVWACYLVWEQRSWLQNILAGCAAGLAIALRPTEAFWILPWLALAWKERQRTSSSSDDRSVALFSASFLLPLLFAFGVAWKTYGTPFSIGYFLRDPIIDVAQHELREIPRVLRWPFEFHLRNILFNVWSYHVQILGLWSALICAAGWIFRKHRNARPLLACGAWTLLTLLLVYGHAIYQDHIGTNVVSLGNSYLRYLLPMAVISAFAVGSIVSATRIDKRRPILPILLLAALVILGTRMAFRDTDESILPDAQKLIEYHNIRKTVKKITDPSTVVFSERSDKIFFPIFRAASPIPPRQEILRFLRTTEQPAVLYSSQVTDEDLASWHRNGLDLVPILENGRERLYDIRTASFSQNP